MATKREQSKIARKELELRNQLWPQLDEDRLWLSSKSTGYTSIPRTMPLILQIADGLSSKPVASAYLDLWCRMFDPQCFVRLNKHQEMAFYSGFTGQRAINTWKERIRILSELGFIDVKPGTYGSLSYALVWNPYFVVREHAEQDSPGFRHDTWNALKERAIEIKAEDLM